MEVRVFGEVTNEMLYAIERLFSQIVVKEPEVSFSLVCLGCGPEAEEVMLLHDFFGDSSDVTRILGVDKQMRREWQSGKLATLKKYFSEEDTIMHFIVTSGYAKPLHRLQVIVKHEQGRSLEDYIVFFVSWPDVHKTGIAQLLRNCQILVYVGRNDGINACGDEEFWAEIINFWKPIGEVKGFRNDMVIYIRQFRGNYRPGLAAFYEEAYPTISPREERFCYNPKNLVRTK
jgi:hypothetical protein